MICGVRFATGKNGCPEWGSGRLKMTERNVPMALYLAILVITAAVGLFCYHSVEWRPDDIVWPSTE